MASFAAGFVGSIASQGAAKALGMQEEVSFKGALISGLATAATAGLLHGVNNNTAYQKLVNTVDKLSLSQTFSIASAAQLMEQNAVSQGINLTLQKHQHFDWEQLATAGITAGLMGSTMGKQLNQTLRTVDHNTGILTTELTGLTSAGANSVVTGSHFGASQVLSDNLGSAVASGLVDLASEKDLARLKLKEIEEELNDYCPIPSDDGAFSRIPEGTYERFHEEVKEDQALDKYQSLSFNSALFTSGKSKVDHPDFESKVNWNSKEHGAKEFFMQGNLTYPLSLSAKEIWEIRAFKGTPILDKKAGKVDGIERLVGFDRRKWNNLSVKEIGTNLDGLQQHVLDAHNKYPNVPIDLINAVIVTESGGSWNAISPTGALGVMQQTADNYYKGTLEGANVNPFDKRKSIIYGVGMLSSYINKFGTTQDGINKTVAAYNQGESHVSKTIRKHGVNWVDHIHREGRKYVDHIEAIRKNSLKIPGYFGEKK